VREKISNYQAFWLNLAMIMPTFVLIVPKALAESDKLGWVSAIFSGTSTGFLQYLLLKLSFDFSNKSVIQDCMALLGSIIGKIIILPYIFVILLDTTLILYEIVVFIKVVMPGSSYIVTSIALALLETYATYTGIENLARLSVIAMFIMIASTVLILIITIFYFDLFNFNRLKPIVFNFKSIVKGSLVSSDWFRLILTLLLIFKPYLKNKNGTIKSSLLGNLLIQLIIVILFIFSIAVFETNLTKNLSFPFYNLTKSITRGSEIIVFFM
jgi:hypothetical protein